MSDTFSIFRIPKEKNYVRADEQEKNCNTCQLNAQAVMRWRCGLAIKQQFTHSLSLSGLLPRQHFIINI